MSGAYDVMARIRANQTAPQASGECCEMCCEPITDEHQHVVNVAGRQLMCVCRGCYLTDAEDAALTAATEATPDLVNAVRRQLGARTLENDR